MPDEFPKKSQQELKTLPRYQRFECSFPFHTMRVDQYEGRVKRLIYDREKTRLSTAQLQYVFADKQLWSALSDKNSKLSKFLQQDYFKPEGRAKTRDFSRALTMVD